MIDRPGRIHSGAEVAAGGAPQHKIDTLLDLPHVLRSTAGACE